MGNSSYSDDAYKHISASRAKLNDHEVKHTVFSSRGMKPSLDPKGVKVRESRDSVEHPESNAIGVLFDVTGSMQGIPIRFARDKLGKLMSILNTRNVIPHPQLLFGAIGDAHWDTTPFQVGQFESGLEADGCLTDIYIEGNGGGGYPPRESYNLAHYFFARHTSIDCWEKRGKKGYLFTFGDEHSYDVLTKEHIEKIFGDTVQGDESTIDLIRECEKRYHVFHIFVGGESSHAGDPSILAGWKKILGERALKIDNPDDICELIATTIGICEGIDLAEMSSKLHASGASAATIKSVATAIVPVTDSLVKAGSGALTGTLPDSGASGGTVRL